MNKFDDVLRIFRNLTLLSISLGFIMAVTMMFKFGMIQLPVDNDEVVAEQMAPEIPVKEELPGEIGTVDPESGLIIDHGLNIVKAQCGACHSTRLVAQNRFTRDGWKDLIRWMQQTQNLWDLGEQEDVILDYLAKNFAPQKKGRRKPLENVDWYVLK